MGKVMCRMLKLAALPLAVCACLAVAIAPANAGRIIVVNGLFVDPDRLPSNERAELKRKCEAERDRCQAELQRCQAETARLRGECDRWANIVREIDEAVQPLSPASAKPAAPAAKPPAQAPAASVEKQVPDPLFLALPLRMAPLPSQPKPAEVRRDAPRSTVESRSPAPLSISASPAPSGPSASSLPNAPRLPQTLANQTPAASKNSNPAAANSNPAAANSNSPAHVAEAPEFAGMTTLELNGQIWRARLACHNALVDPSVGTCLSTHAREIAVNNALKTRAKRKNPPVRTPQNLEVSCLLNPQNLEVFFRGIGDQDLESLLVYIGSYLASDFERLHKVIRAEFQRRGVALPSVQPLGEAQPVASAEDRVPRNAQGSIFQLPYRYNGSRNVNLAQMSVDELVDLRFWIFETATTLSVNHYRADTANCDQATRNQVQAQANRMARWLNAALLKVRSELLERGSPAQIAGQVRGRSTIQLRRIQSNIREYGPRSNSEFELHPAIDEELRQRDNQMAAAASQSPSSINQPRQPASTTQFSAANPNKRPAEKPADNERAEKAVAVMPAAASSTPLTASMTPSSPPTQPVTASTATPPPTPQTPAGEDDTEAYFGETMVLDDPAEEQGD